MFIATKGDRKVMLLDSVQVAAFRKSGWDIADQAAPKAAPAPEPLSAPSSLREQADALGIKYHPSISDEKLAAKIAEARADE